MNAGELWRIARHLGRGCLHVIQSCLREEEWGDADEEFARIIFDGLKQRGISAEGGDGGAAAEQLHLNDLRADRKR